MRSILVLAVVAGLNLHQQSAPDHADKSKNSPSDQTKVLDRINGFRKAAGLDLVTLDDDLSKGCQLHAIYLTSNSDEKLELETGGAHREVEGNTGFTVAGAKSAKRAVIGWSKTGESAFDYLLATLYHRVHLLEPRVKKVGIGFDRSKDTGALVMDLASIDWNVKLAGDPIAFPYADQEAVPLEYNLGGFERPDPRPDPKEKSGYPITLMFAKLKWQPSDVKALLTTGGTEVDSWLSSPEQPAIASNPQEGVVCLIPKKPLKEGTKYTVTVSCKQIGVEKTPEWSKSWSFTTQAKAEK